MCVKGEITLIQEPTASQFTSHLVFSFESKASAQVLAASDASQLEMITWSLPEETKALFSERLSDIQFRLKSASFLLTLTNCPKRKGKQEKWSSPLHFVHLLDRPQKTLDA